MSKETAPVSGDQQLVEMMKTKIASHQPAVDVRIAGTDPGASDARVAASPVIATLPDGTPEQSLEAFSAINILSGESRSPGCHQGSWNRLFIKACEELAKRTPKILEALHPEVDRLKRSSNCLSKMKKRLKETRRLKRRQQRKWNDSALDALNSLLKAHSYIGQSKLRRACVDEHIFDTISENLKNAARTNQRAARGVRRYFGNLFIDQRVINGAFFRSVEKLVGMHGQLNKLLQSEQARRYAEAVRDQTARDRQEALARQGRRLQEVHAEILEANYSARAEVAQLREIVHGKHEQVVGQFLRQVRDGDFFGLPKGLLAECAATSNYLNGWQGPMAGAGVWFNEPIVTCNDPLLRGVWICTSERVVERYWVMSRMYRIPLRASILDAGCSESTLAVELASSGYSVTAVDQRRYSVHHPSLKALTCDLCSLPFADDSFDVAIFLSTIEHLGIGHYGDEELEGKDVLAMREAWRVLKPGGTLLLTTPYGVRNQNDVHRIYDASSLARLLEGFEVFERGFAIRRDKLVWERCDDETVAAQQTMTPEGWASGVALIAATKRQDSSKPGIH